MEGGGAGGGDGEDEQPVRPTRCVEVEPSQSRTLIDQDFDKNPSIVVVVVVVINMITIIMIILMTTSHYHHDGGGHQYDQYLDRRNSDAQLRKGCEPTGFGSPQIKHHGCQPVQNILNILNASDMLLQYFKYWNYESTGLRSA